MAAVTPLPTLSQLRNWDTNHLSQAADNWDIQARQLESTFEHTYQRLATTDWKGEGRDAHVARAGLDLVKIRRLAEQLREAASAARHGFDQQNGAIGSVLAAVADAQAAGFEVNEDLSVDGWFTGTEQEFAAARARAQALSAQIRHRAALLMSSNQEIATRITAAAGNIGEFRFDEPAGVGTGSPLDTKPKPNGQRMAPTAHARNAAWVSPAPPEVTAPPTDGVALTDGGLAMRLVPPSQVSPSSPTTPTLPAPLGGARPGAAATPLPAAPLGGSPTRVGGTASGLTSASVGLASTSTAALPGAANLLGAPVTAAAQAVPVAAVAVHPPHALLAPDPTALQPQDPSSAQLPSTAEAQHEQAPPTSTQTPAQSPAPSQLLPPPEPARPPAEPQSGPPPSHPAGVGGPGIQMLGMGLGGAPQAPPSPIPLDPAPPVPPAVPPIADMTKDQALAAWEQLIADKAGCFSRCDVSVVGPLPQGPYNACVAEINQLKEREAALRARLGQLGVRIADEPTPAPTQPSGPGAKPKAPGSDPAAGQPGAQESPGKPGGEPPVPQNVQDTLEKIDAGNWPGSAGAPGTRGGSIFDNDGEPLPPKDASGNPITYTEWDVNPKVPNQGRDSERIITGSDGSAWYTTDHYGTFHRIR